MFQIGTDHIINPTIYLKEPRRPGSTDIHESNSPNSRPPDYTSMGTPNPQYRNPAQSAQSYSQYPILSRQENPRGRRQNDGYYRSNVVATNSGGYNRNLDRGMHQSDQEDLDPDGRQYYYDQYGYSSGQPSRSTQGYSNNYSTNRDARQAYPPRDTRGSQQYPVSDYEYDPRWNQQEPSRTRAPRQQHRDMYGVGESSSYQQERGHSRDTRHSQPQTWAAYQEYENPNQRNTPQYYPRNDQRGGGRQGDDEILPHDLEDYRRGMDFDPTISQYGRSASQENQTSGWLDIEGLIGNDSQYNGIDSSLDLNFEM
jgi:hypothetical protein